ncbi:MAG: lipopolysaccharide biosynthesis protein [Rhizobiales bacterium]|nr:lipopolysaccharide biosynthesis protein [Hyphomicrobiales bacterium]
MQTGTGSAGRSGVTQAVDELDLGALGRALWRRIGLITGLTLLAGAIAFAAVNWVTPRYKSEARVLIETRENAFLRPEADRSLERGATVDQEAVTSQVQLILSRDLAIDVIRKLKLGDKPEFDPVLRGSSTIRTILSLVGLTRDPMSQTPEERVLKSYMDRLAAFQVEKSRVIAIEFESEDPELAARVVNAIADGFLVRQQGARQDESRNAAQFLSAEIEKLRRNVSDAEGKVEQYRNTTNLMIGTNNTTLSSQQLGDVNAQVASARALKADAESKARIIRDALRRGAATEISDVMNSEQLRRLSEQQMTLRAQLAEQSSTLLGQHPRIKELRAQISNLDRQIRSEAERIARAFENDAAGAAARLQSLTVTLDQLKKQAASSNVQDVKLRALEREAKSQRDLLESYLAKYREATARDSIGASSPEARIISRGIVSTTPSWPKKIPTVLIASLGMLTLAVGFILTGQLMNAPLPVPATSPVTAPPAPPTAVRSFESAAVKPASESLPPTESILEPPAVVPAVEPTQAETKPRVPPQPSERSSANSLVAKLRARLMKPAKPETADSAPAAASAALARAMAPPVATDDTPLAASVPPTEPAAAAPVAGVPAEAIEGLAQALATAGDSGRRIAVVGARRNMGTTLAAISLARALAKQGRAILIDLALESPNLSVIASDANTPGLSDLVQGSASFGQIITRDRYSRVHLITAGKADVGSQAILNSQRLSITLEALSRSYDYVVLDAGALPEIAPENFARLAPRAVLVADDIDGPATESARERLLSAGFPNVSVLASDPDGPESDTGGSQAAA